MKKIDLKKMAAMGLASGLMLASQATAHVEMNNQTQLAKCGGGRGGCGGYKGGGDNIPAYYHQDHSRQSCGAQRGYTADAQTEMQTQTTTTKAWSDSDFRAGLNEDTKSLYDGLSADGKIQAQKLASQGQDKNAAVKQVAQQMTDKRGNMMNKQSTLRTSTNQFGQ